MLKINLERIARERGIYKLYTYLTDIRFTHKVAADWASGKPRRVDLDHLERACVAFKCEPHDIIEWVPAEGEVVTNHPLKGLLPKPVILDVKQLLNDLPKDQLRELLEEMKKRGEELKGGQ